MDITLETTEHVAKLARLELTPDEKTRYTNDLSAILNYMDQLNQLDLSKVDTAYTEEQLQKTPIVYRQDEGVRTFTREYLLANAPHEEDGFFRVPKILDSGSDE